jgi:hypothetical protein
LLSSCLALDVCPAGQVLDQAPPPGQHLKPHSCCHCPFALAVPLAQNALPSTLCLTSAPALLSQGSRPQRSPCVSTCAAEPLSLFLLYMAAKNVQPLQLPRGRTCLSTWVFLLPAPCPVLESHTKMRKGDRHTANRKKTKLSCRKFQSVGQTGPETAKQQGKRALCPKNTPRNPAQCGQGREAGQH